MDENQIHKLFRYVVGAVILYHILQALLPFMIVGIAGYVLYLFTRRLDR